MKHLLSKLIIISAVTLMTQGTYARALPGSVDPGVVSRQQATRVHNQQMRQRQMQHRNTNIKVKQRQN